MLSTCKLVSLEISTGNYQDMIAYSLQLAGNGTSSYICVANVHMLVEAYKDAAFAQVVNNADVITPDGMPLVVAMKALYGIRQDRVAGMDLLPDLLQSAARIGIPVFFYGGTGEMLEATKRYCNEQYPQLKIAGCYSPPFRSLTESEVLEVEEMINNSNARLVFVALGCPKQEKWMAAMHGRVNACMIGVGGALPVMIGQQKRAPVWMQKMSLEWLYRLLQEPRRLFRRYAVTNSHFIYLFFKQWLRQGLKPVVPAKLPADEL